MNLWRNVLRDSPNLYKESLLTVSAEVHFTAEAVSAIGTEL